MSERYKERDWLYEKYITENLKQSDIAKICNCSDVTISNWLDHHQIDTGVTERQCYSCKNHFKGLGKHWNGSSCSHPKLSEYQKEVITGILMGDGCISGKKQLNPVLEVSMIKKEFLEYIDEEIFPNIGMGVKKSLTAEESAENARNSGFIPGATSETMSDQYNWFTHRLPELKQYRDWYSTGEKVWPSDDIELSPTILKYLYVCDGSYKNKGSENSITIGMSNEYERRQSVSDMFSRAGLNIKSFESYENEYGMWMQATFSSEETDRLFEYMGEPLPGFEYKWPNEG